MRSDPFRSQAGHDGNQAESHQSYAARGMVSCGMTDSGAGRLDSTTLRGRNVTGQGGDPPDALGRLGAAPDTETPRGSRLQNAGREPCWLRGAHASSERYLTPVPKVTAKDRISVVPSLTAKVQASAFSSSLRSAPSRTSELPAT